MRLSMKPWHPALLWRSVTGNLLTLRTTIVALSAAFLLTVLAGSFTSVIVLRINTLDTARRDATQLVRLLADRVAQTAAVMDLALIVTRESVKSASRAAPASAATIETRMRELAGSIPSRPVLEFLDASGHPLYSTRAAPPGISYAATGFFRDHAASPTDGLQFHREQLPGFDAPTQFIFSKRVSLPNGAFAGAVLAAVDPAVAARLFSSIRPGIDAEMRVLDGSGREVVSFADLAARNADLAQRRDKPAPEVGGLVPMMDWTGLRQESRIVVRDTVRGFPYTIELSRSQADVLAPWRRSSATILGACLLVVVASGGVVRLLLWQLRRREGVEQDLVASRTLLQTVFDTIPSSLLVKDTGGRILLANAATAAVARVPKAELIGAVIHEWSADGKITPAERSAILESDRKAYAAGKPVEVEVVRTLPEGLRKLRVVKAPFLNASGEVGGLVTLTEDVTDKVRMQDELRRSQNLLTTVFDTIPSSLIVKDPDGRVLLANSWTGRMVGKPPAELIGKVLHEWSPVGDILPE